MAHKLEGFGNFIMKETSEQKCAMLFSIKNSFRSVKRFFKDLAGKPWLILHFVIAIGLIAGTSSMLQEQETADNIDNKISIITPVNYPFVEIQQVSKPADTFFLKSILLYLLGR
jgi:hypothetical protein